MLGVLHLHIGRVEDVGTRCQPRAEERRVLGDYWHNCKKRVMLRG
jgi:hypothetical protein